MADWFPAAVYTLSFAASATCAILLIRGFRKNRARLLFWSGLCFLFLAANNFVVVIDMLVVPQQNFRLVRILLSLVAVSLILFGLIWPREERR